MHLVYLGLRNFLSFRELDHNFVDEPVLIKGKNLTEIESKETNGSGKSSMLAGIAYAIMATSLRKSTLDRELILWGEQESSIMLDIYCPIRQQTLMIRRSLKLKGSSTLNLYLNQESTPVVVATVGDGNNYILNWLGMTTDDLKAFYLLNKENYKSFISSSNNDKLSFINRFIKAEQLVNSKEVIKNQVKPLQEIQQAARDKISTIEGELKVHRSQLEEEQERDLEEEKQSLLDDLNEQAEDVANEYEKADKDIKGFLLNIKLGNEQVGRVAHKLKHTEDELTKYESISFAERYEEVKSGRSETDREFNEISNERTEAQNRQNAHELRMKQLQLILSGAVTCPACGEEFIPNDTETDLGKASKEVVAEEEKIKKEKETLKKVLGDLNLLSTRVKMYDDKFKKIRAEESIHQQEVRGVEGELRKIRKELISLQDNISDNERFVASLEKSKLRLEREAELIMDKIDRVNQEALVSREAEIKGVITLVEKKLEKATIEYGRYEKEISDALQWGIRFEEFRMSLAVEQLRVIQNFANLSLQRQKSELRLSIDGFKRNAKGDIKSEITVLIINGAGEYKTFWSFSGGERARVELALIQAFQEMINRTNPWGGLQFLMIDEVLEGTDPLGLALLLESMKEYQHPIYIISHVMNIRAGVRTLTVVKENGFSYIEEG